MRAILKSGIIREFSGADVKEISISIFDDIIVVLHSGEVLIANSLNTKE